MNRRYENFTVGNYDTFGFEIGAIIFPNEFRYNDRERYEEFIRGEHGRFIIGEGFELHPRQQHLPLTQEQQLQIQHIDNILARSQEERDLLEYSRKIWEIYFKKTLIINGLFQRKKK
jgi:hypothetical protein